MTATDDKRMTQAREPRRLLAGQTCEVRVFDIGTRASRVVFATDDLLLEAPNWTHDGRSLVVNGNFGLWLLDIETGTLSGVDLVGAPPLNNDHVLDVDGRHVYLSGHDGHIYRASLAGGAVTRLSDPTAAVRHFLHGVDRAGERLCFVGLRDRQDGTWSAGDIYSMSVTGTDYRRHTHGPGHSDGCEFLPDGGLVFNSERFDGHAQLARIALDGSFHQLTFDERVNWFPHVSPDGSQVVYVSFPPATEGHPANLPVELRLLALEPGAEPVTAARLFGGQGSMNVNSWSPDGSAFAYVSYPVFDLG